MQYFSLNRVPSLTGVCANACLVAGLLAPLSVAAVQAVPTDLQVVIETRNSGSNPGPFSAGSDALIHASFRIDASVTPTGGGLASWAGAMDDLVLTVNDSVLGTHIINGQDGNWQQLNGGFIFGKWDLATGLSPLSVLNPALSDTPFVLEEVKFQFRGPAMFATTLDLPTNLSHTAITGPSDFSFLDLTLTFSHSDPAIGLITKLAIIRGSAFESVTISPVPEPHTLAMLMAGLMVVGGIARRRRR